MYLPSAETSLCRRQCLRPGLSTQKSGGEGEGDILPDTGRYEMTALIVGGDYIKPIEKIITDRGVPKVRHWTGRKAGDLKRTVPKDTQFVVLLLDYLNHGLAKKVRGDADRLGLPVIYCRRSLGQFCEKLDAALENGSLVLDGQVAGACCDHCPLRAGTPG